MAALSSAWSPADTVNGDWLTQDGEAVVIRVRVTPRAGRDRVDEIRDNRLRVRVASAPADGAANDSVRRLLARSAGVAKSRVELLRGAKSREKDFRLTGASAETVRARIVKEFG